MPAQRSALLGHTGFVGANLAAQFPFTDCYNSKNIQELTGREYDLVVCSAVSAVKWQANRQPAEDWARIQSLLDVLGTIQAKRFVLISTIDVYANPRGVDEQTNPLATDNHAYGKHRAQVEVFARERFPVCHIVRLPGLFGPGLKKNVIFDLLHDNCLAAINPASSFQYYDLARLWGDVEKTMAQNIPLLNLATGPIPTKAILQKFFPDKAVGSQPAPEGHYDFRSIHAAAWGGRDGYLYDAKTVMEDLGRFIAAARR